mgnify:CR=1 FL=1
MQLTWINAEQYHKLYSSNFVELPIQIDMDLFEKQIEPYKDKFRNWGETHVDSMFRKGISVVNMTGNIDDEVDPCCYPQDQYNKLYGTDYFDNHYTKPTEILNLSCFDPLEPLKPYMIRSAILWWKKGSHFKPHIDTELPCVYLRVWATNNPAAYNFTYFDGTNHTTPAWKPGQLYLADTVKKHYAEALDDNVYTLFFNFDATAYDLLMDLKNGIY